MAVALAAPAVEVGVAATAEPAEAALVAAVAVGVAVHLKSGQLDESLLGVIFLPAEKTVVQVEPA